MDAGLYFWRDEPHGLTGEAGPAALAHTEHWQQHAAKIEPWKPVDPPCDTERGFWWRSARTVAPGVVLCGECSSSLDVAWLLNAQGCLTPWDSVLCAGQWAGRGQLRREWLSLPGNIFAAWKWPQVEPQLDGLLPCMVGYVLVRAFQSLGVDLKLKWPNDLLHEGRKVGGVLVEERAGCVMAGIGLNLHHAPETDLLRQDHAVAAGILPRECRTMGLPGLWLHLVEHGLPCYRSLSADKDPELISREIEKHMAFVGQRVRLADSSGLETATVMGLAKDGRLRLYSKGAEYCLHAGSIIPL